MYMFRELQEDDAAPVASMLLQTAVAVASAWVIEMKAPEANFENADNSGMSEVETHSVLQ